jgi:hypothetical protein
MPRAYTYHCGPTVKLASQIICMTPSIVYDLSFKFIQYYCIHVYKPPKYLFAVAYTSFLEGNALINL